MPGIGLEYGIAGLLGEGLKGFADSYGAEKDRQRKQAEADDERAYRARKMEGEDFDSGRVWDPEKKNYKAREGEGLLTKSEQKLLSGGLEARKSFGEDWYRKENEPLRTAVDALLRKQFGAQTTPTQSALPGGAGLMPREPDTARVAPKSAGLLSPQTPRQKQIAETEALGTIPAAGSAPAPKPFAGASVSGSPYEPLKKKIAGRHAPGYDPKQWGDYVPKAEREQRQKNESDLLSIQKDELKDANAPAQKMQGEIAGTVASQSTIANSIYQGLQQLEDPKIPEDQKVVIGREMLKTLNSQMGKDAIGAEEAQRLGGLLEYKWLNFMNPGPVFGRDVPAFTKQVRNNYNRLRGAVQANEGLLTKTKRGESLVPPELPAGPKTGDVEDGYVFQGGNPADPKSWKKK